MSAMRDRLSPGERLGLVWSIHSFEGRFLAAPKALREIEKIDSQDLVTNYLIGSAKRAPLAALLGDREQAVTFLRNAFARGLSITLALHRQLDFESLRGFPPFDDLMQPKG